MSEQNGQAPAAVKEKPWQVLEDEHRRAGSTGPGVAVTFGGTTYRLHFGEMNGLDVAAMRRQSGYSAVQLANILITAPDVDALAVVIWMCRRLTGEPKLSLDDVAKEMHWGAEARLEYLPVDDEPTPQAPPEISDEVTGEPASPPA